MSTTRRLFDRILSELRGSAGLDFERLLRSVGRGADAILDALDPDTLAELMLDPDWKRRLKEFTAEFDSKGKGTLDKDKVRERLAEAKRQREANAKAQREEAARKRAGGSSKRSAGPKTRAAQSAPDDPWKVLGIPRTASHAQIKMAYHQLAKKHHPDALGPNSSAAARQESERRMREINDAWSRLKDLGQ